MKFITQLRRVPAVDRTCLTCRNVFLVSISDTKRGGGKYCGPLCYRKAQAKNPNKGTFKKGNHPPTEFKKGNPKPEKAYAFPFGEKHPNWKGEKAKYFALHNRVIQKRGQPQHCEVCDTTKRRMYHWANLTGKYHDVFDYKRMCVPCHRRYDIRRANHPKSQ